MEKKAHREIVKLGSNLGTWPPDVKPWLTGKDPDAGKGWGQRVKGVTVDEMVGWHHWLNGHEFEQPLEIMKDREVQCAAVHGVAKRWTWLSSWTTTTILAAGAITLTSTLHCLLVVEEPLDLAKRTGIQFVLLPASCIAFDEPHNLSRLNSYLSKALPFSF